MNERLILPNQSPIKILTIGGITGLLLIAYLTFISLQQPWLGIDIQYQPGKSSLKIKHVFDNSPAENILKAGDEITGFEINNKVTRVNSFLNIEEPAILPDYKSYNKFIKYQSKIHNILINNKIILKLKDKDVVISPQTSRPLASLPFTSYWLVILLGFTAFILGINIWSFRRGIIISRILAIAGTGFFIGALFNAVTLSREIVLAGDFYFTISSISHLGIIIFAFSTITILWHYPQRISLFPATKILYLVSLLIWINQTWQITATPLHVFYFHFMLDFVLLAILSTWQWHNSRKSIIDRAALKWLLFTLLVSLGFTIALFYFPTIYSAKPILPVSTTYFSAFLVFLGLTMGVIKYRLFNLPPVWMYVWRWVVAGSLLLLIDLALIYLLDFTSGFALILSAIIVGWIYFPVRQWLSINILKLKPKSIELYFPLLIDQLITTQAGKSFDKKWEDILRDVFLPLEVKYYLAEPINIITVSNNGINLRVPTLDNKSTISLTYKDSGNKLYSQSDIKLCNSLLELTQYTANIQKEHEEGAQDERTRIARDLHDDIAAQLLTLIHRSKNKQTIKKTRYILSALRETIYSLDTDASINLLTVFDKMYQNCNEKANLSGLMLYWESVVNTSEIDISPRQHINLQRSIDEILSNVIQHAKASQVTVFISLNNRNLHMQCCDNGTAGDIDNWVKGNGMYNITTRMKEINGSARWHHNTKSSTTRDKQGCCINLQFPI